MIYVILNICCLFSIYDKSYEQKLWYIYLWYCISKAKDRDLPLTTQRIPFICAQLSFFMHLRYETSIQKNNFQSVQRTILSSQSVFLLSCSTHYESLSC